jgi:hypothetical protein
MPRYWEASCCTIARGHTSFWTVVASLYRVYTAIPPAYWLLASGFGSLGADGFGCTMAFSYDASLLDL